MRPTGLAERLPPGWAGKNLTDETWVCGFLGMLWPMGPRERRNILQNLTREQRDWIFRLFDNSTEMVKRLMLTGVFLEYKTNPRVARRKIVTTAEEILKACDVTRCLACREVSHSLDRHPTVPLCTPCATDLSFIGHDLREICRRLRKGEKIA